MGTLSWLASALALVVVGAVAGRLIAPRRGPNAPGASPVNTERDPYGVSLPIRIVAILLGIAILLLISTDLVSGGWRGARDAAGSLALAAYFFYCGVRGRSVPWLESPDEALLALDRLTGQKRKRSGSAGNELPPGEDGPDRTA